MQNVVKIHFSFLALAASPAPLLQRFISQITCSKWNESIGTLKKWAQELKKSHICLTPSIQSVSSSWTHLHSPFLFSAPLALSMCSNHHLGKPDKLRGRHQHLGVELKSCLETAGRLTRPTHNLPSMEVRKWHPVHSLPVSLLSIYFCPPSFIHPPLPPHYHSREIVPLQSI